MLTNISASQRKLLQYFDPIFSNVDQMVSKLSALTETTYSENQEIIIKMSGGYQIISLALADSLFIHDKKNIQEILLRTINESFRTMTIKVKNILVDFQFIDLLNSIPKELLTELGEFRKGYVKKINQFEIAPNIFVSENNKITFTVSGGLKFLSIELSSDYFDIKEKKNIEMELLHSINNIFFSIREEYYHLTQEANDRIKKNPDEIK